jgi:hypothetical protein
MTFMISLPTTDDLATLPIVDITPEGVWIPSAFNKTHCGLSFGDSSFSSLAQKITCHPDLVPPVDTPDDQDDIFHDATPLAAPDEPGEVFHDSLADTFPDGGYFFDPLDSTAASVLVGHAFHLTLNCTTIIDSVDVDQFLMSLPHEELRGDHEVFDPFAYVSGAAIQDWAQQYVEYSLGYHLVDIIHKTLENTSQLAHTILCISMQRHIKAHFPWLYCNQLRETVATDTYFATVRAIGGATCAQVFYGVKSHMINIFRMKLESEMPEVYVNFIREEGAPSILRRDNSQIQSGTHVQ